VHCCDSGVGRKLGNREFDCKRPMSSGEVCEHVHPGQWPFQVELVLDDHLGFTEALVRCRHCGATSLLRMLDWRGPLRVMRMAPMTSDHGDRLIRDLTRGSCDVNRAGAELQHVRLTPLSRVLILIDTRGPRIEARADAPAGVTIPGAAWRDLPCNGEWVDYVRSNTEMVNG